MHQQSNTKKLHPQQSPSIIAKNKNNIKKLTSLEKYRNSMPKWKKIKTFLYTFLAYTSVHATRASNVVIRNCLGTFGKMVIITLLMLISFSIGNFVVSSFPSLKPIRTVWVCLLLCSIFFCVLPAPLAAMFSPNTTDQNTDRTAFAMLCLLMSLNGFLTGFLWPNLLYAVHLAFSIDEETAVIGFWSTCPNFGNIIGYVIIQWIVSNDYTVSLAIYIISGYMMLNAIYIGLMVDELPKFKPEELSQQQNKNANDKKNKQHLNQQLLTNRQAESVPNQTNSKDLSIAKENQFLLYNQFDYRKNKRKNVFRILCKNPRVTLLIISLSLFKSVMDCVIFFLIAFNQQSSANCNLFSDQSGYALSFMITFQVSSILGSVTLGMLLKRIPPHQKNILLIPILIFLMIIFITAGIFLYSQINANVVAYFLSIGVTGVCLGGAQKIIIGLATMELVRVVPPHLQGQQLRIYSSVLMAVAHLISAVSQVLFIAYKNKMQVQFTILTVYCCINFCCVVCLVLMEYRSLKYLNVQKSIENSSIESKENIKQLNTIIQDKVCKSNKKVTKKQLQMSTIM